MGPTQLWRSRQRSMWFMARNPNVLACVSGARFELHLQSRRREWGLFGAIEESPLMNEIDSQLDEIASRALTLYSRPSVAMELVRLTEQPRVDAQALKDYVAQDP